MSDTDQNHREALDEAAQGRIDVAAQALETAWKTATEPLDFESFLPDCEGAERICLLGELIQLDIWHRWRTGHGRQLEDYPCFVDELRGHDEIVLELLSEECRSRAAHAQCPTRDELRQRFPGLAGRVDLKAVRLEGQEAKSILELPTGHVVGNRYEIRDYLGRGAMGTVYRAYDQKMKREVALKVLFAHPAILGRFHREVESAAAIESHPNICQIFDADQIDGTHFITMQLIEGQTLDRWAGDRPMAPKKAAAIMYDLACGLAWVHQAAIVHRDITDRNVMIDAQSRPILMDFGVARPTEPTADMSATGFSVGTLTYMSPQQVANKAADTRSDIYSMGVLLYRLLAGRLPFRGENLIEDIREKEPRFPAELRRKIPKDLRTICLKCLEKQPSRRFLTAELLAEELRRFRDDEPLKIRSVGPLGRTWRWCLRNRLAAGLTAALILALAGGVIVTSYLAVNRRAAAESYHLEPWQKVSSPLRDGRGSFGLVPLKDMLFIFGGFVDGAPADDAFLRFAHGNYLKRTPMPARRTGMACTVQDGLVYVIAGNTAGAGKEGRMAEVWQYDPSADRWKSLPSLSLERDSAGAAAVDGSIYVVGGHHEEPDKGRTLSRVDRYNPEAAGQWEEVASMRRPRCDLGVVAVGGKLYAIGGLRFERKPKEEDNVHEVGGWVEVYDPHTDAWKDGPSMPTARYDFATAVTGSRIYCIGGRLKNGALTNAVEYYDVEEAKWCTDRPLPIAAAALRATIIGRDMYVVGGIGEDGEWLDSIYTVQVLNK